MANASQKLLEQGEEQRREQHTADGGGRLAVAPDAIVVASVEHGKENSRRRSHSLRAAAGGGAPAPTWAVAVLVPGSVRERREQERDEHGQMDPIDSIVLPPFSFFRRAATEYWNQEPFSEHARALNAAKFRHLRVIAAWLPAT